MSWVVLATVVVALGFALFTRRDELRRMRHGREELALARSQGTDKARLQHPHVDLSRCMGCGLCVQACPEEGVLEILHGQAVVVHGARCVGHGRCADECPVAAIAVVLSDVSERTDLPVLAESFESATSPGVFLAGEVTGYALVRTAIAHGTAVASEVARRIELEPRRGDALDLVIVGAGPAGLACSLEARRLGLEFVTLEREELGGTVAKYPRRKLVMTQPVNLPLHGRLSKTSYSKEELMQLWQDVTDKYDLPIRRGVGYEGLERSGDEPFRVHTSAGELAARYVCFAVGRRGTPRKLGVPGEELTKVSYGLMDAAAYTGRRILVVGGGDSAVEAAVGLSEQDGNEVVLSYRKPSFTRIKARNLRQLESAREAGRLRTMLPSEVVRIAADAVELREGEADAGRNVTLGNDDVFVFAGGTPPFGMLAEAGISFDPALRETPPPMSESGTGLAAALGGALVAALLALAWTLVLAGYYGLALHERPGSPLHAWLRPAGPVGLSLGALSVLAITVNLAYLVRRNLRLPLRFGSLQRWMTLHVVTGVGALILALVHSAMSPGNTVGGHALAGLVVLVATGAVGRYLYAFVPRAANGRELEIDELRGRMAALSAEWDQGNSDFAERAQREVERITASTAWRTSLPARVGAVFSSQRELRRTLARLEREGEELGVAPAALAAVLDLTRRAHRAALAAAHFEELRGLLATWRWMHRWVALLMVLLVLRHVVIALRYGGVLGGGS